MSSLPSPSPLEQQRTAVNTLKTLLLDDSVESKANLLSLLHRLNIHPDSVPVRNWRFSCPSPTVWNNSSVPFQEENRSAFYRFPSRHGQLYPSLDHPLHDTAQQAIHPSRPFHSPVPWEKRSSSQRQSSHSNLPGRTSPTGGRKEERISSWKSRIESERKQSTDDCHYRQTITIRQLSCHDIIHSPTRKAMPCSNECNDAERSEFHRRSWTRVLISYPRVKDAIVSPAATRLQTLRNRPQEKDIFRLN